MERIAPGLLRYRSGLFVLIELLSAISAYQLRYFSARANIESLSKNDPEIRTFEQFIVHFENADLIIMGLAFDDVFRKEHIEFIRYLTRKIEYVSGVLRSGRSASPIFLPYEVQRKVRGLLDPLLEQVPPKHVLHHSHRCGHGHCPVGEFVSSARVCKAFQNRPVNVHHCDQGIGCKHGRSRSRNDHY